MGEWLKGVTVPAFDGDIGFTFAICRVASSQDMSVCAYCGCREHDAPRCALLRDAVAANNFYLEGVQPKIITADIRDDSESSIGVDMDMYEISVAVKLFITNLTQAHGKYDFMRKQLWIRLVDVLDRPALAKMIVIYRAVSHLFRHFPTLPYRPGPLVCKENGLEVDREQTGWNDPDVDSEQRIKEYARDGDHASSSQRPAGGFLRVAVRAGPPKVARRTRAAVDSRKQDADNARQALRGTDVFPMHRPTPPRPVSWQRPRPDMFSVNVGGNNLREEAVDDRGDAKRRRRGDSSRRRRRDAADSEVSQSKRACWSDLSD